MEDQGLSHDRTVFHHIITEGMSCFGGLGKGGWGLMCVCMFVRVIPCVCVSVCISACVCVCVC